MLTAGYSVNRRIRAEGMNRTTTLAAEYETIEALASSQGETLSQATDELKAQGLGALTLTEGTIGELITSGRATLITVSSGPQFPASSGLKFSDLRQLRRVQIGLRIRFHGLAGNLVPRDGILPLPPVSPQQIRQTAIGLDPDAVLLAKVSKLQIIGRIANPYGVDAQSVKETLAWLKANGTYAYLPLGDQVLGRKNNLNLVADELLRLKILYASPEFTKIGGDTEVVKLHPENVIRLHTAQIAELDRGNLDSAIDRFIKAARERQLHILLVRPESLGGEEPFSQFSDLVKSISSGLRAKKIPLGIAHPSVDPDVPKLVFPLLGLAIAGCLSFVVLNLFDDQRLVRLFIGLLVIGGLACFVHLGRQVMAFLASGAFPVLGFLLLDKIPTVKAVPKFLSPLPGFLAVSLCSLIGGLCVAGMLNGLPYMVKADEFRGIKVSVFVPILIVGWIYVAHLLDRKQMLATPITWGSAALGVFVMGVLGFMLMRTGNDSSVGASGGELQLRGFLDTALFVRPRTKEFMVGHPILYIAIGLLAWMRSREHRADALSPWIVLAMMVGSIGQTSVVNTLCHLHIPVTLSLARIGLGVLLGSIIGIAVWLPLNSFLVKGDRQI